MVAATALRRCCDGTASYDACLEVHRSVAREWLTTHASAGAVAEKMNKCDKAACAAIASEFADRLKKHGVEAVKLQDKVRYHGRFKVMIDTIRENGIAL